MNLHELQINPTIRHGHRRLGGHKFINMGKLPNHLTNRDHIWHTYTDSSGNGHRLKSNTSSPKCHGGGGVSGSQIQNCGNDA